MHKVLPFNISAKTLEQLGSKEKFWFIQNNERWLFKYSRENSGEHWSEKVAESLCIELRIPHAKYEIAESNERKGVVSKSVVPDGFRLVMGNEVLHATYSEYPKPNHNEEKFVRVKEHTISRVLGCLDKSKVLPPISDYDLGTLDAGDVFCGYLMLDALISNQDRHHENWAIIIDHASDKGYLSPTYDHAASLGHKLTDGERQERMLSKDKNRGISFFVSKARSELFKLRHDSKALLTVDAFNLAIERRPKARTHWLSKLAELSEERLKVIFSEFPPEILTDISKEFALGMIMENKKRLLDDSRS